MIQIKIISQSGPARNHNVHVLRHKNQFDYAGIFQKRPISRYFGYKRYQFLYALLQVPSEIMKQHNPKKKKKKKPQGTCTATPTIILAVFSKIEKDIKCFNST